MFINSLNQLWLMVVDVDVQTKLPMDIFKDYFEDINNSGFEYAYIYPGMNKVLQAAGRVIEQKEIRA